MEFIKSSSKEEKQEFLRLNHLELFELFGKNPNRRKILEQLFKANLNPVLNNLKVGDKINFGNYRYDPIEWIVLKKNKKTALLITAESIFYREFDKNETSLWTFSSLRKNLNSSFYEQSFSDEEKSSLLKDRYWLFFTDKISIPTVKQVKKYLKKIPNVKSGTFWALASFNLMSVIYTMHIVKKFNCHNCTFCKTNRNDCRWSIF